MYCAHRRKGSVNGDDTNGFLAEEKRNHCLLSRELGFWGLGNFIPFDRSAFSLIAVNMSSIAQKTRDITRLSTLSRRPNIYIIFPAYIREDYESQSALKAACLVAERLALFLSSERIIIGCDRSRSDDAECDICGIWREEKRWKSPFSMNFERSSQINLSRIKYLTRVGKSIV